MKIKHKTLTAAQLLAHVSTATSSIGDSLYGANLCMKDAKEVSAHAARFRLGAKDSHEYGARRSHSGRHTPNASWEAHRDVLREVFRLAPDAVIETRMATYKGADGFEQEFPATAHANVGSMMFPATMPSLSVEKPHTIEFGTLQRDGTLTDVRLIKQSDIRKCPHFILVASHYRPDGSCKCDDAGEREMMIREWEYTPDSFAGIPLRSGS
jgi:hypothetical protein